MGDDDSEATPEEQSISNSRALSSRRSIASSVVSKAQDESDEDSITNSRALSSRRSIASSVVSKVSSVQSSKRSTDVNLTQSTYMPGKSQNTFYAGTRSSIESEESSIPSLPQRKR